MTSRYRVGVDLAFVPGDAPGFDTFTDALYEELLAAEEHGGNRVIDPDMSVSMRDLTTTVEMLVDGEDLIAAQLRGLAALQSAVRAVRGRASAFPIARVTGKTVQVNR